MLALQDELVAVGRDELDVRRIRSLAAAARARRRRRRGHRGRRLLLRGGLVHSVVRLRRAIVTGKSQN